MILLFVLACARAPEVDATPYAGVLARADTNHDGGLSEAEYRDASPRIAEEFSKVDEDGDQSIRLTEIADLAHRTDPSWYDPALTPNGQGPRPPPGRRPPPGGGAGPGRPLPNPRGQGDEPPAEGPGSGFDGSGPPLARATPNADTQAGGAASGAGGAAGDAGPRRWRAPKGAPAPTMGDPAQNGGSLEAAQLHEALAFEAAELHAAAPDAPLPTDEALLRAARAGLGSPEAEAVIAPLRAAAVAAGLPWPGTLNAPAAPPVAPPDAP